MGQVVAMRKLKYILHRTRRKKTIALKVERDGRVVIRAPRTTSKTFVRRFFEKKLGWILEKQNYFRDLLKKYPPKEFKNGEAFPLLGRNYRLKIVRTPGIKKLRCKTEGKRLRVFVNGQAEGELQTAIRQVMREWYLTHTGRKALVVLRKHAPALEVYPGRLRVVEQTKRWASCSKKGDIRVNWRLSMMPMPVLEYVVVHELCHLKVHDHSSRFWKVLKSVLPDYEKRRAWLRQHGPVLALMFHTNAKI